MAANWIGRVKKRSAGRQMLRDLPQLSALLRCGRRGELFSGFLFYSLPATV
jgi:hypothetical protein